MKRDCCDDHVHCKNCDVAIRPDDEKMRNDYCGRCRAAADNGVTLEGLQSCIVQGCRARSDREDFVEGLLCHPCHAFITTGVENDSQAHHNERMRMAKAIGETAVFLMDSVAREAPLVQARGSSSADRTLQNLARLGVKSNG